jgi:hypothetical protein
MTLMFDKTDVDAAGPLLVRLMRLIFYRYKITLDGFAQMVGEHGRRLGSSADAINVHRNNLRNSLNSSDMTWRFFYYMVLNILRLEVVELRIILREKDGTLIEIGSKDRVDDAAPSSPAGYPPGVGSS